MRATMYGWEIDCPPAIGSAASSYACSPSSGGTNSSRGTRSIAASTRSSAISRSRSCCCTINVRSSASDGTRQHPLVRRGLETEMLNHGLRDVDDAAGRHLDADRQHRNLRVTAQERAVTAAAHVV